MEVPGLATLDRMYSPLEILSITEVSETENRGGMGERFLANLLNVILFGYTLCGMVLGKVSNGILPLRRLNFHP